MSSTAGLTATRRLADEARVWMHVAVELADENKELRGWLTAILIQVATRDELLELGRAEIDRRWPTEAT